MESKWEETQDINSIEGYIKDGYSHYFWRVSGNEGGGGFTFVLLFMVFDDDALLLSCLEFLLLHKSTRNMKHRNVKCKDEEYVYIYSYSYFSNVE